MINYSAVTQQLADTDAWIDCSHLGDDHAFYRDLCEFLAHANGFISVVFRTSPFKGPYTEQRWIETWISAPCFTTEVDNWLGTNTLYIRGKEEKPGRTEVRVYRAKDALDLLNSVDSVFAWHPPRPDDFAAYLSSGMLMCFANQHESESSVQKDLCKSIPLFGSWTGHNGNPCSDAP